MSQPQHRRDNLADLIFDMETDVRDLTRWASTVAHLATADSDATDSFLVVGRAMKTVAERVETSWERAFDLSRSLKDGR